MVINRAMGTPMAATRAPDTARLHQKMKASGLSGLARQGHIEGAASRRRATPADRGDADRSPARRSPYPYRFQLSFFSFIARLHHDLRCRSRASFSDRWP
jgi:hypothetical protein